MGAAASAAAAGAAWGAAALGHDPQVDPLHFVSVGAGAFALGCALVQWHPELAPDPALRKGVAPRAFWTLAVGVAIRGVLGDRGPIQPFLASASLAGVLLEVAALSMLLYGAFVERPSPIPQEERVEKKPVA